MAGTILILDSVATNRIILRVKLSAARYNVLQAETLSDAVDLAITRAPDLILVDHAVDGGGPAAVARLRAVPGLAHVPTMIVARDIGTRLRLAAFEAGADAMIEKPMNETLLLARIRNLLRRSAAHHDIASRPGARLAIGLSEPGAAFARGGRIAVIRQSGADLDGLTQALAEFGRRCAFFAPDEIDRIEAGARMDAILIDLGPGQGAASLRLLTDLQSRGETRLAAHLCVIDDTDDESAVLALDLGVHDLIRSPPRPLARELALRLDRQLTDKLKRERLIADLDAGIRLSVTDPLTGLYNRRYAMRELDRLTGRRDACRTFAVMVIDLDRFKTVNDRFGHVAGDAVLREIAARLRRSLRAGETIARIGGEEFVAILPDADAARAHRAADRLRRVISDRPVTLPGEMGEVGVTVSIGLCIGGGGADGAGCGAEAHLELADRALYASKGAGRNQVTLGQSSAA